MISPIRTYCGVGKSLEINKILDQQKDRIFFVDKNIISSDYYGKFLEGLNCKPLFVFDVDVYEEPSYKFLDEIFSYVKDYKADEIIGIGGGSVLDITKAIAILRTNGGKAIDYRGFDKVKYLGIPTVLIPTTAGSGSEATDNAVFIDTDTNKKLGINGQCMQGSVAILDANWLLSAPYPVLLSSALDAIIHAIESFSTKNSNIVTRTIGQRSFELINDSLRLYNFKCNINPDGAQQLLGGAHLAAYALCNSGSGIAGAMSYPLGVHYKVPHGFAGAMFLRDVVQFNRNNGYNYYELALNLNSLLDELYKKLEVEKYIKQYSVDFDHICSCMKELEPAFEQNPIPFYEKDAIEILRKHFG